MENPTATTEQITQMLTSLSDGDRSAAERLLPIVYEELRNLADRYLRHERADHTLQATALVHEAYLRLVGQKDAQWQNKVHFYRVAAEAMRRILVNHARDHRRLKRGGGARKLSLEDNDSPAPQAEVDLVALDEALSKLALADERKAQIVQLRYFGGLTIEETAEALDLSPAQIKRDWTVAKLWLLRELAND